MCEVHTDSIIGEYVASPQKQKRTHRLVSFGGWKRLDAVIDQYHCKMVMYVRFQNAVPTQLVALRKLPKVYI